MGDVSLRPPAVSTSDAAKNELRVSAIKLYFEKALLASSHGKHGEPDIEAEALHYLGEVSLRIPTSH